MSVSRRVLRILAGIQRRELLAWLLLAAVCGYAATLTRQIKLRFGFTDVFAPANPVRQAYERFEREFDLRPKIYAYFEGPGVFARPFLAEAATLSSRLERIQGVHSVFSALDLPEPVARQGQVRLMRLLRDDVVEDPAALARALASPPFTDRWHGFLYDPGLTVFALTITLAREDEDLTRSLALLDRIEAELGAVAARTGAVYFQGGLTWVNHELMRATFANQERLTLIGLLVVLVMMALLFGSLSFAVLAVVLLGISVHLAFGTMVLVGLPINGMSGNLPLLIIIIGLTDIVHLASSYAGELAKGRRPRAAALRAAHETFFANLMTALASLGCALVSAFTELQILHDFSLSMSLGICFAWAVTIVFGPPLLLRTSLSPGHGLYGPLHTRLEAALAGGLGRVIRSPRNLGAWALALAGMLYVASTCRIDSNWFLLFTEGMPVARTRDFLARKRFPASPIDCRIPNALPLEVALSDPATRRDLDRIEAAIRAETGVLGVFTLGTAAGYLDDLASRLELPATMAPEWQAARRAALRRDFLASGALDEYVSLRTRDLRILVTSGLESAKALLALGDRITARVRALPLETLDPRAFEVSGQMLYWGAIMKYVGETFLTSAVGAMLVVFLGFVLISGSVRTGFLALLPNLPAPLAMFCMAKFLGKDLNENFIFLCDMSLGIAVDDTLHFLYHERLHREEGEAAGTATFHALSEIGAPIVVATMILVAGFSVCFAGTLVPTVETAIYLDTGLIVAMLAELLLTPALLRRDPGGGTRDSTPDAPGASGPGG